MSSLVILHEFLKNSVNAKELLQHLSEKKRNELNACYIPQAPFDIKNFNFEPLLEEVHYSWLIPTLKSYTQLEQELFLQALSPNVKEKIARLLKLYNNEQDLSDFGKSYFRKVLLSSLAGEENALLPREYLPPSSINNLLEFPKKDLLFLIDQLGLYDIAAILGKIVDKTVLKTLNTCISKEQSHFLQTISERKEEFSFPQISLSANEKEIRTEIHKRGLYRLSYALANSHPQFIWYIAHTLDIGRGSTLLKFAEKKCNPHICEILIQHIVEITKFFNLRENL